MEPLGERHHQQVECPEAESHGGRHQHRVPQRDDAVQPRPGRTGGGVRLPGRVRAGHRGRRHQRRRPHEHEHRTGQDTARRLGVRHDDPHQQRGRDVRQFLRDAVQAVRALQQLPVRDETAPHRPHDRAERRGAGAPRGGEPAQQERRGAAVPGGQGDDGEQGGVQPRHGRKGPARSVPVDQRGAGRGEADARGPEQGHGAAGHGVRTRGVLEREQEGEGGDAVGEPPQQRGGEGAHGVRGPEHGGVGRRARGRGRRREHDDIPREGSAETRRCGHAGTPECRTRATGAGGAGPYARGRNMRANYQSARRDGSAP